MKVSVCALVLSLLASAVAAQDKPLVIPQVEGAKQGRVIGRAIACGVPQERTGAAIAVNRQRMLAAVGAAFTEDRYLPALNDATSFEASLPKPSEAACAKAVTEFEALERAH
ncbi:hypothetical protein [Methylobacterium gnaphalii]|uniref:Lipoprotein n=1 Tax=Methylobacterium gnaphalii TaxID=1010610 RepID=A0A512JGX9_9HYPH|nr:hypothetical protein [Methylobacterium gnaphalii]GEP09186.1 hypothetical protein MGN01_10310 [Methylobacterium gnaphalii]GJD67598.1 hypothetical protein MMMDOFMJ_0514 [Methylobacterium gnaphalii]GLS50509.1 hypothetical protein GCM10007885_33610 [Methylobacterium gnaphalii]